MSDHKRVRKIENIDEARALAFFLAKERMRHMGDVLQIDMDLKKLETKWDIKRPTPEDVWVDI